MAQITYDLDEFRPFRQPNGDTLDCLIYGSCEIVYDSAEDWGVYSITIESGSTTVSKDGSRMQWNPRPVRIDDKHPLWDIIERALETHYRADVERAIADDIGACSDVNAEHRHSHHEYGLAR